MDRLPVKRVSRTLQNVPVTLLDTTRTSRFAKTCPVGSRAFTPHLCRQNGRSISLASTVAILDIREGLRDDFL